MVSSLSMRAILTDLSIGRIDVAEIPVPALQAAGILVRTAFSAISAGTERNTILTGRKSLLGKALARPDLVRQVIDFARHNGISSAYRKVQSRLESFASLGYSCSGTVIATAAGVTEFRPGDRVACAGAGYATHSEVNFIPRRLAVKIPESVGLEAASLTTIGAIAIQGLRQAQVGLGETIAVIGAGLVGVLTIQLAKAAGCRVAAIDSNPVRAARAKEFGADLALNSTDPDLLTRIAQFSTYGVDAAIVTAAATSAEPLEMAANCLRDRGQLVVVGTVPVAISRDLMFRKELSLSVSRSYGPGRYDPQYEKLGNDYPVGHVRWTEQRNMEAFLSLLASGAIDVSPLLKLQFPIGRGADAYIELERSREYTAILDCGQPHKSEPRRAIPVRARSDVLRLGCIGAGAFARSTIIPELRSIAGVELTAVAAASGNSAFSAQRAFGFQNTRTADELVTSADVDSVFILSRHDTHARYVCDALGNHKPVFVEKPLATTRRELFTVCSTYDDILASGNVPFLMIGFNRRFAPASYRIAEHFANRSEPMLVHIRVNAGYLDADHWSQRPEQGGRIVGELCHFVDWARFIVGQEIHSVFARALPDTARYKRDNVAVTLCFADGSLANLLYLANGDKSVGKECYEVFCEGSVARLDNFASLELIHAGKRRRINCRRDKGHRRELELTIIAMREGQPSPIPFDEVREISEATFAVIESINSGYPITVGDSAFPSDNTVLKNSIMVEHPA